MRRGAQRRADAWSRPRTARPTTARPTAARTATGRCLAALPTAALICGALLAAAGCRRTPPTEPLEHARQLIEAGRHDEAATWLEDQGLTATPEGLELLLGARAQARRFDQALGLIEQDPSRVSQTVIHDICVSALVDAFDAASLARERVTAVEARCALLPDEPRIDREAAQLLARTVIDDRLDLERWTDLATRLDGLVDSELDDAETDMTGELLLRTALYGLATVAPEQRGDLLVAQLQLLDAVELRTALGDWYIWRIGVMANEDRELATRCADLLLTDAVLIEDAARHAADDLRADLAAPGGTGETGEDAAENADGSTPSPTGATGQVPTTEAPTEAPTDAHTDAHTARPCPLPVPPQP